MRNVLDTSIVLVTRCAKWGPLITFQNMASALIGHVKCLQLLLFEEGDKRFNYFETMGPNNSLMRSAKHIKLPKNPLKKALILVKEALKCILRHDVIVFNDTFLVGLFIMIMAKLMGRTTIFIPFGFYYEEINKNVFGTPTLENALARVKLKLGEPILIRLARMCILPDHRMYEHIRRYSSNTIVLWPDCGLVDVKKYRPHAPTRHTYRKKLGLKSDAVVIGYIGRLNSHSGFDLFIEVAKKLINDNQDVKFLIIGDGPYRQFLEQLISKSKDRFFYLGYVGHSMISKWMQTMDIALMPNREPLLGLSNTFLELLCSGVTVVTTPVGTRRFIQNVNKDLCVITNDDAEEIVSVVNDIVDRHKKAPYMRGNAFARRFSYLAFARSFTRLIVCALDSKEKKQKLFLFFGGRLKSVRFNG